MSSHSWYFLYLKQLWTIFLTSVKAFISENCCSHVFHSISVLNVSRNSQKASATELFFTKNDFMTDVLQETFLTFSGKLFSKTPMNFCF